MAHGNGHADVLKMALTAMREALAELHRRIIEAARIAYESERGKVRGPGELLELLMQDPYFSWLRPLSELVADLDALAGEPATEDLASTVRGAAESLVLPGDQPSEFWLRYSPMLQEHPAVAVAHGQVRKVLGALPASPKTGAAAALRERHKRALARKRQR